MSEQLELPDRPIAPEALKEIELPERPFTNETSEAAWLSVKDCGWATKKMKQAYRLLYEHGPLTILELEHMSAEEDGRKPRGRSESTVIRRLSDLRQNGLAGVTKDTRLCSITNKVSVMWMVTGALAPENKYVSVKLCPHCGKVIK